MLADIERDGDRDGAVAVAVPDPHNDDDDDDDSDEVEGVGSSSSSFAPTLRTLGRLMEGTVGRSVARLAPHSRIAFLTHTYMKTGGRGRKGAACCKGGGDGKEGKEREGKWGGIGKQMCIR